MIGEATGVALNYAMTRTFPTFDPATEEGEKEYHLIYDSGALSTTATVIAFYQTSVLPTPKSKTRVNTTHIEVLGVGWEDIGGVMLDLTIQEVLLEDFVQKSGKHGVREDKRAMAKLVREANRVKHILSANQESNVGVSYDYVFHERLTWVRSSHCTMILTIDPASHEQTSRLQSDLLSLSSPLPSLLLCKPPVFHSLSSPLSSFSEATVAYPSSSRRFGPFLGRSQTG